MVVVKLLEFFSCATLSRLFRRIAVGVVVVVEVITVVDTTVVGVDSFPFGSTAATTTIATTRTTTKMVAMIKIASMGETHSPR